MLHFAPAVFAAVYMKSTDRFVQDVELQKKIKNVLRTGVWRLVVRVLTECVVVAG